MTTEPTLVITGEEILHRTRQADCLFDRIVEQLSRGITVAGSVTSPSLLGVSLVLHPHQLDEEIRLWHAGDHPNGPAGPTPLQLLGLPVVLDERVEPDKAVLRRRDTDLVTVDLTGAVGPLIHHARPREIVDLDLGLPTEPTTSLMTDWLREAADEIDLAHAVLDDLRVPRTRDDVEMTLAARIATLGEQLS